jgi:type II secretory pathway pseudopilin PulG
MNSVKCPHCGLVNWVTAETCKRCEYSFTGAEAAPDEKVWEDNSYRYQYQNGEPANQWDQANAGYQYQGGYQQGGYQYQGAGYGYPGYAATQQKSGLAITSMVFGIISLIACGLLGAGPILGLIFGIVALKKASNRPMEYGGKGFAVAGIVLSIVSFFYVGIVMAIAIPNLLASRRAANEAGAIRNVRLLAAAQETFQATAGDGRYGTLQELANAGLIDEKLSRGVMFNYVFEVKPDSSSYEVLATPKKDEDTSGRSFYLSSADGVVRGAKKGGMAATAFDPPLNQDDAPPRRQAYRPRNAPPEYSPAY